MVKDLVNKKHNSKGDGKMTDRVIAILIKYTDIANVYVSSMLEADFGLTSFDVVSIVTEFEDEFHIEIPDRDIGNFTSLKDIIEYLEARV